MQNSKSEIIMNNIRKGCLYTLYIIGATIFFIYYLFPLDAAQKYLSYNLRKTNPDFNINIDHIKPAFPLGLRLHKVNLYHLRNDVLDAKQIKIVPGLLSLFGSKINFSFKIKAYKGIVGGKGEFAKSKSPQKVVINAKLSDIHVQEIFAVQNLAGRTISGMLDGKIKYTFDTRHGGKLNAELTLSDCDIELLTPVFSLDNVSFAKIEADVDMQNHQLQVKQCIIKGDQLDGAISGSVTFKNPVGKSVLNLSGTIKPHQLLLAKLKKDLPANFLPKKISAESGFPVRFTGTIDKPGFSLK